MEPMSLASPALAGESFTTTSTTWEALLLSLKVCMLSCFSLVQLCDPMDCNCQVSVYGILQARILEWVAMPSSRDLLNPGIQPAFLTSRLHWQVDSLPLLPPWLPPNNHKQGNLPLNFVIPVALSSSDSWVAFSDSKSNLISPMFISEITDYMQSCFSCVQLFETLWTVAYQAPLSMGFSRQERILVFVAMPSSRASSRPGDQTHICLCLLHCRQILFPLSHLGSPKRGRGAYKSVSSTREQGY